MRLRVRMYWTIALALFAIACAPKNANLTPTGQTAYTADQAVIRVNELENAAIQANAGGALDTKTTRLIVTFAVDADATLAKTPAGWIATVQAAWGSVKPQLDSIPPTSAVGIAIVAANAAIWGLK